MIGQTVSHYRIIEELGEGGMGRVYKAEDTRLHQPVALKFLSPELTRDPDAKTRFVNEVRSVFALEHPNICNVHELDETPDGQLYLCMAYYEGQTLKKRLAEGAVPVNEALEITRRVALGLESAHAHGIVHRDIKPGNIILTRENDVKIVDFGIAKLKGTTRFTKTGRTLGTLIYMSPEQARGDELDGRSDIFSLGVVLYELLAGQPPFRGDRDEAVAYQIVNEDPPRLSDYRADISDGLQRVIDQALRKNPDERYRTVTEFKDDIERILRDTTPRAVQDRRVRIGRRLAAASAVVLALLALGFLPPIRAMIEKWVGPGGPDVQYLAVLPLENIGGDRTNQAFCDGIMEMLTSELGRLQHPDKALWVIPASDVRKEGITSAREANQVFGAKLVVTGSVQRVLEEFRLTLNLVDVSRKTPRQLNSVVINDRLENLTRLQDETALKMAGMLDVELEPRTRESLGQGRTSVSRAYDLYVQGLGYLQRYDDAEQLDLAVEHFEKAIKEDPRYALAYSGLGQAYWRKYANTRDTRWVAPAIDNCERAVVLGDRSADVHVALGLVYKGTGRYEKSIGEFERALAIDSLDAEAYRGLAGAYGELGKPKEAEETYKRAIALKPGFWGAYNDLGLFYFRAGRFEEALPQFEKVSELTPDNTLGYNNVGACYWSLGRLAEARAMFEKSLSVKPTYRAYSNLSLIHYAEGRYEESAKMVEKAIELNDESYFTWSNLGNAYYWIPGRREEAIDVFRRCARMAEEQRKVNPRDEGVLMDLAAFYAMTGEGDLARTMIDQALAIAADNMTVMYEAGHAYEQVGERDKALAFVGKAVAAGYSVSVIRDDPFMRELTADDRFAAIVEGVEDE